MITRSLRYLRDLCGALALLFASLATADTAAFVDAECAACHRLEPVDRSSGAAERLHRQAPPLQYAGNKYREQWLVEWLQNPVPVHPQGFYQPASIVAAVDRDSFPGHDEAHPQLEVERAREVAEYLMALKPYQNLIDAQSYEPGTVALRMGAMDFRRFKGCGACHQDEPGRGGLSGPELHTAWERLQPDYLASYIENPTLWDPNTMMPATDYNADAVKRLVDYLHTIGRSD